MRFVASLLLTAVALLPLSVAHAATIDENNNGLDDVWELVFHASGLDPNADDDGDGFINSQECAAGTDPHNAASHPPAIVITTASGNVTLSWGTVLGKQYRVQTSDKTGSTAVWTDLGIPLAGTGGEVSAVYGVKSGVTRFYRVQTTDLDSDGDGVSDWEELQLGFDPYRADTFNSGFGDRAAILNALASTDMISVAAPHAAASTALGDAGVFQFTRTGNLDAVSAYYTVSGTGIAGTDYTKLSGKVSFPVGVNTVNVTVTPLTTATFVTHRSVIVTLSAHSGYQVNPSAATSTATVTLYIPPATKGQVVEEFWDNINGWNFDYVPFDTPANRRVVLKSLEGSSGTGYSMYGSRIRGYITAPTTGTYTFWVAADDIGEFRLSTDDQMANLVLRANAPGYTGSEEWNKYATQKSAGIALTAGKRYAFEARLFQYSGGDNLAVGWLKPGETGTVPSQVVPGSVLSAYVAPFNPPGLTTLYFGALDRVANAPANAQGFASLRLADDNSVGILSVSFSGMSGAPTSIALRGPADPGKTGALIAEFVKATPQTDGTYLWNKPSSSAVSSLKAGRVYVNLATAANSAGELAGHLLLSTGTGTFTPPSAPPALPTGLPSASDAARLLTQATFGATNADLAVVQRDGYAAWVDAQLAAPATLTLPCLDAFATSGMYLSDDTFQEAWWKNALTAPDQLRQRVAFALSEIMVVSAVDGNLAGTPQGLASYYDTLLKDAFGNYRTLLEDVTLHPVMGEYLNMLHNDKPNPTTGTEPNENYGRESMQLFAIGLKKLNPDGSLLLDSNSLPIPTYGQEEVEGISHAFTGWNFSQNGGTQWDYVPTNYRQPMTLVSTHHDDAPKRLLDNVVLPTGQSGTQDLKDSLDILYHHPNAGPFFCRQLIQHLVTSNPSPGYVYRVAQVFANNGQGVRGDLRAVVRAILLDYEARSSSKITDTHYGKEREPVIRLANVYRAFNARALNSRYEISAYNISPNYGEAVLDAPSVFNFFSPSYTLTGEIASAGLVCPEFAITTATSVIFSSNDLRDRIAQTVSGSYPANIVLDLSAVQAVAGDSVKLVDSLNVLLLNGQISSRLHTEVVEAVRSIDSHDTLTRSQTAVQLICTSPSFCIQK